MLLKSLLQKDTSSVFTQLLLFWNCPLVRFSSVKSLNPLGVTSCWDTEQYGIHIHVHVEWPWLSGQWGKTLVPPSSHFLGKLLQDWGDDMLGSLGAGQGCTLRQKKASAFQQCDLDISAAQKGSRWTEIFQFLLCMGICNYNWLPGPSEPLGLGFFMR